MPVYEIEMPGGKLYEIEAPSQQAALAAIQSYKPKEGDQSWLSGVVDSFTNGITMGFSDELTAAESAVLGRTPEGGWFDYSKPISERYSDALEAERGQNEKFREENPVSAIGAEIGGAVLTGTGAAKGGLTLMKSGGGLAKKAGLGALEGAGYGAVAGAGHSEGDLAQNAQDALIGAVAGGGVGLALPTAGQVVKNAFANKMPVRTIDELKAIKTAAYKAVDDSGFRFSGADVDELGAAVQNLMTSAKMNSKRHPKAASMVDDIAALSGKEQSLTELDQLRQVVSRDVARATDQSEARLGSILISGIDDFIEKKGASEAITTARAANTTLKKAEALQKAVRTAELRAASTGSGGNADNAIRQNVRRILEKAEDGKVSFTADEKKLLERIVVGTAKQNALRLAGKLSPSGNGLMAALNLGVTVMNPFFAVPGAIGLVSKALADKATTTNVAALRKAINGVAKTKEEKTLAKRITMNAKVMRALVHASSVDAAEVAVEAKK